MKMFAYYIFAAIVAIVVILFLIKEGN